MSMITGITATRTRLARMTRLLTLNGRLAMIAWHQPDERSSELDRILADLESIRRR